MLVLTRSAKRDDNMIQIGPDIFVQVLEVRGGKVRLGITAPREVQVFRQEVLKYVKPETQDKESGDAPAA